MLTTFHSQMWKAEAINKSIRTNERSTSTLKKPHKNRVRHEQLTINTPHRKHRQNLSNRLSHPTKQRSRYGRPPPPASATPPPDGRSSSSPRPAPQSTKSPPPPRPSPRKRDGIAWMWRGSYGRGAEAGCREPMRPPSWLYRQAPILVARDEPCSRRSRDTSARSAAPRATRKSPAESARLSFAYPVLKTSDPMFATRKTRIVTSCRSRRPCRPYRPGRHRHRFGPWVPACPRSAFPS